MVKALLGCGSVCLKAEINRGIWVFWGSGVDKNRRDFKRVFAGVVAMVNYPVLCGIF